MTKYYGIKKIEGLKNKEIKIIISPRLLHLKLHRIKLLKEYYKEN